MVEPGRGSTYPGVAVLFSGADRQAPRFKAEAEVGIALAVHEAGVRRGAVGEKLPGPIDHLFGGQVGFWSAGSACARCLAARVQTSAQDVQRIRFHHGAQVLGWLEDRHRPGRNLDGIPRARVPSQPTLPLADF